MSSSSLARFFDEIVPFVMGGRTVAELEARLGPSASGSRNLEVYAGVVPFNLGLAMEAVYDSVKRAADSLNADLWPRLMAGYFAAHPPHHWDPNRFGERFPGFLEERRASDPDLPPFLEELADYEWIRFLAVTSLEPGLERTIFVRRYTHAAPAYARAVAGGAATGLPAPEPVTVVVFRSTRTLKIQILYPSREQLFALGRHAGEAEEDLLVASGVTAEDLDRATQSLMDMGLLAERSVR